MVPTPSLDRDQLHDIAVRRRGDPDVLTLLLEIKRLRELAVQALERGSNLIRYTEDAHEGYLVGRFAELFEDEPAVIDAYRPPAPPPVQPETESDRAARRALLEARRQYPHLSDERALKQLAQDRRG